MRAMMLAVLAAAGAWAWDTGPHGQITRAALGTLPELVERLGAEVEPLVAVYSVLPDRYEEMSQYGFVRRSAGPRSAEEIRVYCARPDGRAMHGVSGDREEDTVSVVYLLERIATHSSQGRAGEAARYIGVLSHFIADSLSPPHAVSAAGLTAMTPRRARGVNVHGVIERSAPEFELGRRRARRLGGDLVGAARAIVEECYAGAEENRRELRAMVKAVVEKDETGLDRFRLRAARRAAEILADALVGVVGAT